ncbi:peptidase M13 [Lactobacillus delbrueckii subsp. bulgaricus]|uniref:M13 family metallopeptidase n=1 Tax=Lactobacillus delbrueckii TaxID=1584 RepID=UPI000731E9A1|nr:M13-type metalloendopeptidase [Lactobacillus delbrueckii]ALT46633.1 peptidase M13 [Lactobacillus delbrueckii subsp. bulgaricus]
MNNKFAVRGGSGDTTVVDKTARPQDNLYLAVNSDYLDQLEIPADRSRMGSFDQIAENVEKTLMADFAAFASGEKEVPALPNLAKAVELYKLAKDFDKRNADGAEPIQADLKKLEGLNSWNDLQGAAADLAKEGFDLPFSFSVDADMKNTKVNTVYFGGPHIFLPDTTTYESPDAEKLLGVLKEQTLKLFQMAGVSEEKAAEYVDGALAYDQRLAKVVKSSEEWADYPAMYNPISLADFKSKFTSFDMGQFLAGFLGEEPEVLINTEPRYLDQAEGLLNEASFSEIKGWMLVKFINDVASSLSQEFREAAFPFSQALTGQPQLASGIKQAYRIANSTFSEVVGIYYGQTYFGAAAKEDVLGMIKRMLKVYEDRLAKNDWLSQATKDKAITKLQALILKVGYPDKIEDIYNRLQVTPAEEGGSLYSNLQAASQESIKYSLEKLHQPVDRTVWMMPGNLVNACYDPQRNDITFPAAILQAPFYSADQSRAANYGGIGAVIAHEVSHAFDNNGAQFDEFGNMKNWWTEADYKEFADRTKAEIALFDGLKFGPTTLNGKQIVSENIADQGGLAAAMTACKEEGQGLEDFYANWARVWAQKSLEAAIKMIVSVDVHAPGPLRANVQAQCQDEFYETFDVKPGDGMYLAPEDRVKIW